MGYYDRERAEKPSTTYVKRTLECVHRRKGATTKAVSSLREVAKILHKWVYV